MFTRRFDGAIATGRAERVDRRHGEQSVCPRWVVIGGLAMRIHGSAHITDDLDICYRRTPGNLQAVAAAFASSPASP